MRIIGGQLRGRRLKGFRGEKIRPTADRVRESIFNILGDRVRDATILDLFAGTGAMGIEALSRGADFAVFVDRLPEAVDLVRRNVDTCGLTHKTRVVRWDAFRNLNCLKNLGLAFDLAFLDPPYNGRLLGPALAHLNSSGSMAAASWIVVEHAHTDLLPDLPPDWALVDQRGYGKTLVSFLTVVV